MRNRVRLSAVLLVLGTFSTALAASGAGPSFDCRKARQADEKAICGDPTLARLDVLVSGAYKAFAAAEGASARGLARQLLAERAQCGADTGCLAAVQIETLSDFGADVPAWAVAYRDTILLQEAAPRHGASSDMPLPVRLGQCATTSISELGARLGDSPLADAAPDEGSSVSFANGGFQVSYDREAALVAATVGDPVAICLVSIPRDCPPGDDRGRVYLTFDLRTQLRWTLPDASHMCGGA